jgi:serine/threonine protein kinase/formylglycine-generating enzyme required for sulfatase activity
MLGSRRLEKETPDLTPMTAPDTVATRRRGAASAPNPEPVARVGDVLLGRFRLQRIIGRGGMGVVFAASDLQMQGEPQIAVKLLNEDMRDFPVAAMALERECRKVRMMAHDAIVRVFEFYRTADQTFITMELLDGESLDIIIKRFPKGVPPEDAWPIIRATADALSYAHRQKPPFVHSDFKPSNVFVTRTNQVKVLDFGVARAARATDAPVTNLSIFDPAKYGALTPAYASCEMLAGLNADARDDIYALACVAYELLCGEHPFKRYPADQARSMRLKFNPIRHLSTRANRALAHGLAVDRSDRTSSVAQFIDELGAPPPRPEERRQRQRVTLTVTASVVAAALLGYGVWRAIHWSRPRTAPGIASTSIETPAAAQARGTAPAANVPETHSAPPSANPVVSGQRAIALLQLLGISTDGIDPTGPYPEARLRQLIETSPRKVVTGSTPEQIQAALRLCRQFSSACPAGWYADEGVRTVTLEPFELDPEPVSVRDFRRFVDANQYKTDAETAGFAYAVVGDHLQPVNGGTWRNAIKQHPVTDESPVVGVSFHDATVYCRSRKGRLPTEDEWEYVARGPERRTFPWGDSVSPATRSSLIPPRAADGPAEGIGGRYRGMSGNVWQWVDTAVGDSRVLKGGSWLEPAANKRAAARRMELPDRADEDSGFRCARTVSVWPDAQIWLSRLK